MNEGRIRMILGCTAAWTLPSAAVLVAIWLPFGFSMIGLIEEWDLLGLFAIHGTFFSALSDSPLAAHSLRPLMPLSFAVAHLIDPDSFAGWHWLTLASLLVKSVAVNCLVTRATGVRGWGVVAAVLVLIYPADTMQLSLRSIHINVAIALSLAGAALLVWSFEMRASVRAAAVAVAASLLYLVAICIYEVALTLMAVPLIIGWMRHGWCRAAIPAGLRWIRAVPWLASLGLYVAYAVWQARRIASYQGTVTGDQHSTIANALAALPKLFTIGGARALIGGWIDAARIVVKEYADWLYLGLAAGAIAVVVLVAIRAGGTSRQPVDAAAKRWLPARLMVLGVVLMLMGYAPFLTSGAHMAVSQRTFLWASLGAVFAWLGFLIALWQLKRAPAVFVMLFLLGLGLGAQLFQLHHYVDLSERQRSLLRSIVEDLDPASIGKTILVLDGTDQMGHTWLFVQDGLHYVLSYLYGRQVGPIELCRAGRMEWQRQDAFNRKGRCALDGTDWTFASAPPASGPGLPATEARPLRRLAGEQVVVVSIDPAGKPLSDVHVLAQRRHRLEDGSDIIDRRYRGILAPRPPSPIRPMFRDQFVSERYRFGFGDWWNLDVPPRGAGWREAEWLGDGLKHRSGAWKTGRAADLHFELAPQTGSYIVRGHFEHLASDAVRNSIHLRMNDRPLPLAWTSHFDFQAIVPPEALVRGTNNLAFESDLDNKYYGLSAWLDWVEVRPWPPR